MRTSWGILLGLSILLPATIYGELCTLDRGPAATLLLPYFEVDLASAGGTTTLFAVNNRRGEPVTAHVVLWTDLGVPTLRFSILLQGYDVQTVNLRDVFLDGAVPRTIPADEAAVHCPQQLTEGPDPAIAAALRAAHTGQPSAFFDGECGAQLLGSGTVARGYVTIDAVGRCTDLAPGDEGYFGADGVAGFANVLWGDFFLVEGDRAFAHGSPLVALEADAEAFSPGDYTFYARVVDGQASDGREPLASVWSNRFLQGGGFSGGTDVVVWRDPKTTPSSFACGGLSDEFPLQAARLAFFDEEGGLAPEPFPVITPEPEQRIQFPAVANRIPVAGLPDPQSDFGWFSVDFSTPTAGGLPWTATQAWMGVVMQADGEFSVALEASANDSACEAARCAIGRREPSQGFCVFGPGPEDLQAGQPAIFYVQPEGGDCICPVQWPQHACHVFVGDGGTLEIDATACVDLGLGVCITCGPLVSECATPPLAAGLYTATLGELSLTFQVPSTVPPEGLCVGQITLPEVFTANPMPTVKAIPRE